MQSKLSYDIKPKGCYVNVIDEKELQVVLRKKNVGEPWTSLSVTCPFDVDQGSGKALASLPIAVAFVVLVLLVVLVMYATGTLDGGRRLFMR